MSSLQIHTRVRRLFHYLEDFEKGVIRIPAFQRDFVWNNEKKLELFDSIKKGYPIGSILFWRPDNDFGDNADFEIKNIGTYIIPERTTDFFYILDGFQRLSTLFGCLINPLKTSLNRDDEEWFEKFNIIYNLETEEFEINKKRNFEDLEINKIPLYKLVDGKEFFEFQKKLLRLNIESNIEEDYLKKYEDLSAKIIDYTIPSIDLVGGNIQEAIDIFSRVNSTGSIITDQWKLSATTNFGDFRLGSLINETLTKISEYNFYDKRSKENAFRELIFRSIQSSFGLLYLDNKNTDVATLSAKENFQEIVFKTLNKSILNTIKFLYQEVGVINYDLLPANMQFIFLVEFFNINEFPNEQEKNTLKKWFWQTTFSNYFTIYNPSKRKKAFEIFRNYAKKKNNNPLFIDKPDQKFLVPELSDKITLGSVRSKAFILFMLNYSNNFENFSLKEEYNFSQEKLFKEYDSPENVIPKYKPIKSVRNYKNEKQHFFVNITHKSKKSLDLSLLLESSQNLDNYFISEKMKEMYWQNKNHKDQILKNRKELILNAERKFVKDLEVVKHE